MRALIVPLRRLKPLQQSAGFEPRKRFKRLLSIVLFSFDNAADRFELGM